MQGKVREQPERREEVTDGEESYALQISGHDMTAAHINAQNLWLPAYDLHKTKPVRILLGSPTLGKGAKSNSWLLKE